MPYKNIVFVKLEKRLFSDWRWYMMSERSQLNYIKFLLLAGETYNRIPFNLDAIKLAFKTSQTIEEIEKSIEEIQRNFPKFKKSNNFYYFIGFKNRVNYRYSKDNLGKTLGSPKRTVDIDKERDKDLNQSNLTSNTNSKKQKQKRRCFVCGTDIDSSIYSKHLSDCQKKWDLAHATI